MKKQIYSMDMRGKTFEWEIRFYASPECAEDLRASGNRVYEVVNTIPQWWVTLGFPVKLWCFFQDILGL